MNTIDYFKLQAKNLLRDFKTKTLVYDEEIKDYLYEYKPKYFNIDLVVANFNIDEDDFTLMNAQHVIAKIANFDSWTALLNTSPTELELAKLLYDYQDRIDLIGWQFYIAGAQSMNEIELDALIQIEIFQNVVVEENIFDTVIESYLLKHYD